jgi:hypothetical protein
MFNNKTKKNTSYLLFILISTFFYVPLSAVTASAGFTGGALGEYTNNAHQPNDATILTFNSLGITEAIISDDTDDGTFGGTQGNDYDVTLTFRYSNGTVKSFNASVNWVEITPNISFHNELSSIEFSSFNLGFYFPLNYQ